MNITYVDVSGHVGGGQVVGRQVVEVLLAQGCDVAALIPMPSGQASLLRQTGVNCCEIEELVLPGQRRSVRDWVAACGYFCRNWHVALKAVRRSDLIYVNSVRVLPLIVAACVLTRTSFVVHLHLLYSARSLRFISLLCKTRLCRAVFACSGTVIRHSRHHFAPSQIHLLENGLTTQLSGLPFFHRFGQGIAVGYFGGNHLLKGVDTVVLTARALPEILFHCFGFPSPRAAYGEVVGIPVPDNVCFHPFIEDLGAAVDDNGINVVVVPSRVNEAFGLVAIEAAALGCIPIVSRCEAHEEIAADLECFSAEGSSGIVESLAYLMACSTGELERRAKAVWYHANVRYGSGRFSDALSGHIRALGLEV